MWKKRRKPMMKQKMRDERAVRGAAEIAAGLYPWAIGALAGVAVLTLLLRSGWLTLLMVEAPLLLGCGLVLVQRIRCGLWGRLDEAMAELLNLARAKAFDLMGWTSVIMMMLGFIVDERNMFLYLAAALALSRMRSHVQKRCIEEGWLHGLVARTPRGRAVILRALAIFLIGTAVLVGLCWLREGAFPDVRLVVLSAVMMALAALGSLSDKSMRDSEAAADAVLHGVERRAEREARNDLDAEST